MGLSATFLQLAVCLGASMTMPTLTSLVTVVQGWLFSERHTLTGVLIALGEGSAKHFSAYYRLFAPARWSLDMLGLALFELLRPLVSEGPVPRIVKTSCSSCPTPCARWPRDRL